MAAILASANGALGPTAAPAPLAAAVLPPTATVLPTATPLPPTATSTPASPSPTATQPPTATPTREPARIKESTRTPVPTATQAPATSRKAISPPAGAPLRAAPGVRSLEAGGLSLTLTSVVRRIELQSTDLPRAGMELVGLNVDVTNDSPAAATLARHSFWLGLGFGTPVGALAGQQPAIPAAIDLAPGVAISGWLTFEVPAGAPLDALIWSPEGARSYALGV